MAGRGWQETGGSCYHCDCKMLSPLCQLLQRYIIDGVINFNGRGKPLNLSSVDDRSCVRNEKLVRAFVTKILR